MTVRGYILIGAIVVLALTGLRAWWWIDGLQRAASDAKAQVTTLESQLASAQATIAQQKTTERVVTQYVDRVRIVRERGETIVKEVPVYVPVEADAACRINRGFVWLHDAAARNDTPAPGAGAADEAAPGVALSTVARTVTGNYATCHEIREQLTGLQSWVRAQGLYTGGAPK